MSFEKKGFVYVMTTPTMPGLVKIGITKKVLSEYCKELNSTDASVSFEVQYYALFEDVSIIRTHLVLSKHNYSMEFYNVDVEKAIFFIESLGIPFKRKFCKPEYNAGVSRLEVEGFENKRRQEQIIKFFSNEERQRYVSKKISIIPFLIIIFTIFLSHLIKDAFLGETEWLGMLYLCFGFIFFVFLLLYIDGYYADSDNGTITYYFYYAMFSATLYFGFSISLWVWDNTWDNTLSFAVKLTAQGLILDVVGVIFVSYDFVTLPKHRYIKLLKRWSDWSFPADEVLYGKSGDSIESVEFKYRLERLEKAMQNLDKEKLNLSLTKYFGLFGVIFLLIGFLLQFIAVTYLIKQ